MFSLPCPSQTWWVVIRNVPFTPHFSPRSSSSAFLFFFPSLLSPPLPFTSMIVAVFSPMEDVSEEKATLWSTPPYPAPPPTLHLRLLPFTTTGKKNNVFSPFFFCCICSLRTLTRSGGVSGAVHRLQIKAKVNRRGRVIATVLRVIWGGGLVPI